ncbi:hypothetical protein [Streptosporangium carneum]|uniref:Uncharacterized protein n=1 Tax=Streptosporangium carneum TaxID=47481 RepID=A0A9W6MHP5_9ACTN|nr:hypothetical protein [Streptosporangium carneum]GLK14471.1 hypothetical protein GCM10017600_78830 [Streptosporangium carneum]
MGCLFAAFAGLFPRFGVFVIWLARPALVNAAFDTWIWPLLGLIFLPFTTLMYVILYTPGVGLRGGDWFWIALAVVLDLLQWGSAASQRRQIPRYPRT